MNNYQILMDIIQGELEHTDIELHAINLSDANNNKQRLFQSPVTSFLYMFSFNSFFDHNTYENHTIEIISHFNHQLDVYKAESGPPNSVLTELLPICTKLKQILALFAKIHADSTARFLYERIDKKHIVSDMLNKLFTDGINGPRMHVAKFQHLQYLACKKIYELVINTFDELKQYVKISGMVIKYSNTNQNIANEDNKMSINVTTSSFSAFIYVVNRVGGLLNEPNIAELSRKISRMFITSKSGEISSGYVRNKIHKPNKRDLELTRDVIIDMLNVVNKELQKHNNKTVSG